MVLLPYKWIVKIKNNFFCQNFSYIFEKNISYAIQIYWFHILVFNLITSAQKSEYSTLTISDSLKENANAVVRFNQIDITISSQRNMNIKKKRVITVLNEKG